MRSCSPAGGITSQPLPGLDQATVIGQIRRLLPGPGHDRHRRSPLVRVRAQQAIRQVLAWLWDNAAGPVLHALGYQEPPAPGQAMAAAVVGPRRAAEPAAHPRRRPPHQARPTPATAP